MSELNELRALYERLNGLHPVDEFYLRRLAGSLEYLSHKSFCRLPSSSMGVV